MQVNDTKGVVNVRFTQEEGRRLRDAAYILKRLVANMPNELGDLGVWVPEKLLAIANKYTPPKSQEKLDRQDGAGGIPDEGPPPRAA